MLDEEVDEPNLKKAIEDAQLNSLIRDLTEGVETHVGEGITNIWRPKTKNRYSKSII